MRKIREILRQKWVLGHRHRAIARALGIGVGTVRGKAWGQVWNVETARNRTGSTALGVPPGHGAQGDRRVPEATPTVA